MSSSEVIPRIRARIANRIARLAPATIGHPALVWLLQGRRARVVLWGGRRRDLQAGGHADQVRTELQDSIYRALRSPAGRARLAGAALLPPGTVVAPRRRLPR